MAVDVATQLSAAAGEPISAAQAAALLRFRDLLVDTPIGVTAVRDRDDALERHICDALRGLPAVDAAPPGPLADVGSGGGVPGLVLAVMRPARAVHLIEATGRKAAFVRTAADELGLTAEVHAARSEDVARGPWRESFAVVCARALAPPPVAAELCLPLCAVGGRVVLWTGAYDEAALASAAAEVGGEPVASDAPGFAVLRKRAATPERFPRRPGMAAKRPLARASGIRPGG